MRQRALLRGVSVAALVFAIDQVSKWWAMGLVLPATGVMPFGPFVNVVRHWNTGINFGLLQNNATWFGLALTAFAVTVAVGLLWWTIRTNDAIQNVACGVIAGGALGNAADRVLHGAVYDFINVTCCSIHNPFAFNLADAAVVAGVFVLVLRL